MLKISNGFIWAIKINDVPSDYIEMELSLKLKYSGRVIEFRQHADVIHLNTKGINIKQAFRAWVRQVGPKEYFAKWTDSKYNKDDCIEIFYKL